MTSFLLVSFDTCSYCKNNLMSLLRLIMSSCLLSIGTLDGFSFDSDEEGDRMPKPSAKQGDQNDENGDQANPKAKRKVERSVCC